MIANDNRLVQSVEAALADHQPFGDCDYIWRRICLHYRYRVGLLSEISGAARELCAALDAVPMERHRAVLGDPAVRIGVDGMLRRTRGRTSAAGPQDAHPDGDDRRDSPERAELEAVLQAALTGLTADAPLPPLAAGSTEHLGVWDGPWPWVWSEARRDSDPLGDFFRRRFDRGHPGLRLSTPDSRGLETLRAGARLLGELCPRLARSALSQTHLVTVVRVEPPARVTSLTNPRFPSVVVLAPPVLADPWRVAEVLLHEAMHVKFVDLEHSHSVLGEDYRTDSSPLIRPHWNRVEPGNVNDWPVNRALTVLHVYTCLALFFTAVAERGAALEQRYGRWPGPDPGKQARRAFDRASYLRDQLTRHEQCLGFAGRLFLRWLGDILRQFDPAPAAENSYVHLLLDLYEREADELQSIPARLGESSLEDEWFWAETLRRAARQEVTSTAAALSLAADPLAASTSRTLQDLHGRLLAMDGGAVSFRYSLDEFVSARRSICRSLRAVSPVALLAGASAAGDRTPGDIIREMVEDSGHRLAPLYGITAG